jgi:hypothetical protein
VSAPDRGRTLDGGVAVQEGQFARVQEQAVGIGVASAYTFRARDVPSLQKLKTNQKHIRQVRI